MVYGHCLSLLLIMLYPLGDISLHKKWWNEKYMTSSTMLFPIFKLWPPPCWVSRQQSFYEDDILQLAPPFSINPYPANVENAVSS